METKQSWDWSIIITSWVQGNVWFTLHYKLRYLITNILIRVFSTFYQRALHFRRVRWSLSNSNRCFFLDFFFYYNNGKALSKKYDFPCKTGWVAFFFFLYGGGKNVNAWMHELERSPSGEIQSSITICWVLKSASIIAWFIIFRKKLIQNCIPPCPRVFRRSWHFGISFLIFELPTLIHAWKLSIIIFERVPNYPKNF